MIALITAFTPFIWLQIVGGCVGIAGIVLARRAKRADYRKSLTTAIGMLCSVTGALLCFVAPVLSLVSNIALFFMTRWPLLGILFSNAASSIGRSPS